MKPLYAILISLLGFAPTTFAQNEIQMSSVSQTAKANIAPSTAEEIKSSGEKRTGVSGRWYNYYDFIDAILGNTMSGGLSALLPIWHDPNILQRKSPSLISSVDYLSVAQVIDPSSDIYNNDTNLINRVNTTGVAWNKIYVSNIDDYFVDSISITGSYYIAKLSHTAADSIIISITPNKKYYTDTAAWIHPFGAADTLYAFAPTNVDSIDRCAYSDTTAYPGKTWAEPLTIGSATGISTYKFAPPGGPVFIPAGYHAAITITFKSTDSWIKNVDSINEYNRFMPLFGYEYPFPSGGNMSYWRTHYKNDCNGSALMRSNDTAHYIPTIIDQGSSLPAMKFDAYEYADIGAHITCGTCKTIATEVGEISPVILASLVHPNPANDELIIPIVLSKAADAEIVLLNMLGQIVQTKNISKALNEEAVFNTKNLPQGLYFYSIKVGGTQRSGRVTIIHQ